MMHKIIIKISTKDNEAEGDEISCRFGRSYEADLTPEQAKYFCNEIGAAAHERCMELLRENGFLGCTG